MFKPISIFIGLRYTRAKRNNQFISLISIISMLGIALGVTVLITILSVLNGFDREIKKQIFSMISPITISTNVGLLENWQELEKALETFPEITAIAPFVSGQGLLTHSNVTQPVILTGILPDKERKMTSLADKMIKGNIFTLIPSQFGIILGEDLAKRLSVSIGDNITIATPQGSGSITQITPHFKKFKVVGIFRAGGGSFSFDAKLAFIHLNDAQILFDLGSSVTALHLNMKDIYAAPEMVETLQNQLSEEARINDWTQQLGEFFENIRLTKTMMFFIFILIIAVAVFNLISTMVMVVKNKQSDIAILRTLGATPKTILAIFIVQGATIGIGGTLLGIVCGVTLAWNITAISNWIQHILHIQLVSSNVYFVNYLPSELQWPDVGLISMLAFTLSLLATLYPAWNASRLEPVETLRNE